MRITIARRASMATLGAGLIAAAAVALSSSAPAIADTTDTGGSATVAVPGGYLASLAKSGIIVLPGSPASSSYTAGTGKQPGTDAVTFTVTGGNGELSSLSGLIDLGGNLTIINAAHRQTVVISNLRVNYYNGTLSGNIGANATRTAFADIGGTLSSAIGSGTETFSATKVLFTPRGARQLDAALSTKAFASGADLGSFTTTYDVTSA